MNSKHKENNIKVGKLLEESMFKRLVSQVAKQERGLKVVKERETIAKIWEVIHEIDEEMKTTELNKVSVFDGYIIPLKEDDWFKVMKENDTILGFIYYTDGLAKRYVAEGYREQFKVTEYEVTNIRGVDEGEVSLW